jgi:hypothetical protein
MGEDAQALGALVRDRSLSLAAVRDHCARESVVEAEVQRLKSTADIDAFSSTASPVTA